MKMLVSVRVPEKLYQALKKEDPSFTKNQSSALIRYLNNGYLYQKYQCKKLLRKISKDGTVAQQVEVAYLQGLWLGIGVTACAFVTGYSIAWLMMS